MIVAITGANGFIGRHLVNQFAGARWDVREVVRRDYEAGDVAPHFDGVDVVVHAAGATRAPSIDILRASNVELTRATLDAARRAGAGRFVYLSSQAAAGPASSRDQPVTEQTPPAPIEAYGQSKLDAERLVEANGELPFVILRSAAVYGPGDHDFLTLHRLAQRGVALHPGNREQWISILHVRDLVDGVIRAASDERAVGETFLLANEEPVQWKDLFRIAAACAGRSLAVDVAIPQRLVDVGARIGDVVARVTGAGSLLTREKVALSKPDFWLCSSKRARERMDFVTPTALQDGMCETYHWYLKNGWL